MTDILAQTARSYSRCFSPGSLRQCNSSWYLMKGTVRINTNGHSSPSVELAIVVMCSAVRTRLEEESVNDVVFS